VMPIEQGTCPVCNGTMRVPATGKYKKNCYGYDEATDTFQCGNCGGQHQDLKPTGKVYLRADGTPCKHEYTSKCIGRCYNQYKCKHCLEVYNIDSSD
jgi:hypothetical protein